MMQAFKEFYWIHRVGFLTGVAIGGVLYAQLLFVAWTAWRLRELSHLRERLSRLADGLALLTDTTESGMAALVREVQQPAKRSAPRASTRAGVNKRVVSAAKRGADLTQIAQREALSESEVRLHLKLAEARQRDAQPLAVAR